MATGGSYNPSTFKQSTPFETWAQVQGIGLYWDTENQFAAGKQGVSRAGFSTPGAAYGQLQRAQAPGVNYLGGSGQRQLNFGGRDYGSQAIDRNEIGRIGSVMEPIAQNITDWRMAQKANQTYPTSGPGAFQQWRQKQQMKRAGIPTPPQPQATQPGTLPSPVLPTPSPLATSNWREEQAQRIAEYELGEPGQPTPDPSAGSRAYQEEVARRRANRPTGPSQSGMAPPAPFSRRPSPLPPPPPGSRTFDREAFAPPTVAPVLPSPTSLVGDQYARLAAEGAVQPVTEGAPVETKDKARGVRSTTRSLTNPLTRPLTNQPTGSGGAGAPQTGTPAGSSSRSPRRKR